jgi:hypothetical protein
MAASDLTPNAEREWLCNAIDDLDHADLVAVYRFISTKVPSAKFNTHKTGCSINLNTLSDELISQLYTLVRAKIDTPNEQPSSM